MSTDKSASPFKFTPLTGDKERTVYSWDSPQPAEQPEPSCGWAGCPHGAECVHAKQPEPGVLSEEKIDRLLESERMKWSARTGPPTYKFAQSFARAIEREVLASGRTRPPIAASVPYRCTVITNESPNGIPLEQWARTTCKLSDEEVARIMEAADKYAKYHRVAASTDGSIVSRAARAELERLLKGESK